MNRYKKEDNIFYRILDNYFNRIYIYNLKNELFFKFNKVTTHKSRVVHLEVRNEKRGMFYSNYALLYKIADEPCFTYLETSKNKDGLVKLLNYNENLEYLDSIIRVKLGEVIYEQ